MIEALASSEVAAETPAQNPSEAQPEVKVSDAAPVEGDKSEDAPEPEKVETAEDLKKRLERDQKKIERQKAANREQQRHIQDMQKKLAEYEAKIKPDDGRPKEDDFDDYGEFKKAEGKWEAQQELKAQERKAGELSPEQVREQAVETAKKQIAFSQAQDAYIASNPAYTRNAQVVNQFLALADPQSPSFKVFGDICLDTANKGLEVINYLGANPAKCLELFQMGPVDLRDSLEEIRDSLDAPKKSKDLPEPPNAIRATNSRPAKSMDDMTGRELLDRIYKTKR